jgi:vacuolar-type H+-ATPase subunit E/Vma4
MNIKGKLEVFSRLAIKEAEERRARITKELDDAFENDAKEYESEARRNAERRLRDTLRKSETRRNLEIQTARADARRALYDLRAQLVDDAFVNIAERLQEYTRSQEYIDDLHSSVSALAGKYKTRVELRLRSADLKRARERLVKIPGVVLYEDPDEHVGGYVACLPERRLIIRNSFSERLREEKANFAGMSVSAEI